jgi:hypothetical protein
MKLSRLSCATALLWVLACSGALSAGNPLPPRLVDVPAAPAAYTQTDRVIVEKRRSADPSIDWVVPIELDLRALEYDRFDAFLVDRHVMIRKDVPSSKDPQVSDIWEGYVYLPGDHADEQIGGSRDVRIYVRNNGRVYGSIRIEDSHYTVSTLPSGRHVLTKQDVSKLPSDENDTIPNPDLETKKIR